MVCLKLRKAKVTHKDTYLGCKGIEELHDGSNAASKSNCIMISCQYGPKSPRNVSSTLNICHDELRQASM